MKYLILITLLLIPTSVSPAHQPYRKISFEFVVEDSKCLSQKEIIKELVSAFYKVKDCSGNDILITRIIYNDN